MNAKTTKFLAVLAVLAVAFAGVAVLVQDQTNDADAVTATTSATYAQDYASTAGILSIALEDISALDDAKKPMAVQLYQPKVGTTSATVIVAGNAYYVNADAEIKIPNTKWDEANGVFIFFVLNGVQVKFVPADATDGWTGETPVAIRLVNVASEEGGIITLDAPRAGDNKFAAEGYAGPNVPVAAGTDVPEQYAAQYVNWWYYGMGEFFNKYTASDYYIQFNGEDSSGVVKADNRDVNKFIKGTTGTLNVVKDVTVTGEIEFVNVKKGSVVVTMENFSGTVRDRDDNNTTTSNSIKVANFTGKIAFPSTLTTALAIIDYSSGEVVGTGGTIILEEGEVSVFKQGATISKNTMFKYTDQYGDVHSFNLSGADLTVGMGGFTISAGNSMIKLIGTLVGPETTVTDGIALIFTGNATISGTLYNYGSSIAIRNYNTDVRISNFQLTGSGWLMLQSSVLVEEGKALYTVGNIQVGLTTTDANAAETKYDFALKVANNALVQTEHRVVFANDKAKIWNAGSVVAKSYQKKTGETTSQDIIAGGDNDETHIYLYRVYMNSTYGFGTFFMGTDIYAYGNLAYGAYLDVTGRSTVSLASGTSVVNPLYKYRTMVIATFDSTIGMTVATSNQYPVDMSMVGKDFSGPELTDKSATFRNVIWESASNAEITVVAKEVAKVKLTKDDAGTIRTSAEVSVVDSQGNVMPINDTTGIVELVYGVEYTVTGLGDKNYVFKCDALDLTTYGRTQAKFEMVRDLTGEGFTLLITEGTPTEIVVTVENTDTVILPSGSAVLLYKIGENGEEKSVLKSDVMKITGIYTNEIIYLKAPAKNFCKVDLKETIPWKEAVETISETEWTDAGEVGATATANIKIDLKVSDEKKTYTLSVVKSAAEITNTFTITWQTAAIATHTSVTSSTPNVDLYADEVIVISWTEKPDVRQVLTVNNVEYTKNTPLTITPEMVAANAVGQITLTITDIQYLSVKNSTNTDVDVSDDDVAVNKTVIAGETKAKAIEKKNNNTVTLSIEGYKIASWSYKLDTDASWTVVSGDSTKITFDGAPTTLEIGSINAEKIVYIVKVQPTQHMKFGDYDRVGYFGDTMHVYATADDLWKIEDVRVYYEKEDGTPSDRYFLATKMDGYWQYTLPASNVVLVPDVSADFGHITFVNDGTVLEEKDVKKGETPVYSGTVTPTKPATETESYVWIGWEPELAPVTGDATYTAKFKAVQPTSTDVTIFLEKSTNGVKVTLLANDGRFIQDGSIEFTYTYAYELNGKWATGFKTCTAQTGEIGDKTLFQFTVDLSEKERFSETMWILGAYTSADKAVNAVSELIVYQ